MLLVNGFVLKNMLVMHRQARMSDREVGLGWRARAASWPAGFCLARWLTRKPLSAPLYQKRERGVRLAQGFPRKVA